MSNQPKLNLPTEYQVARISGFPKPIFFRPKLILDCGGNIGCAAVYFANKFPDA